VSDLYLEQYQNSGSFFHHLDARVKLIFSLVFIFAVVLSTPGRWAPLAAYLCVIGLVITFSKLSLTFILKRSLAVLPFALMVGIFLPFLKPGETLAAFNLLAWHITISREGLEILAALLAKSWLSLLCLVWLTATSPVNSLLQALKKLRIPAILVTILLFMYRYIFVIIDEMRRMIQARDCRSSRGGIFWNIRTAGNMIGTLFIRSYERSERVYTAMSARGYDGLPHTLDELKLKTRDILVLTLLLIATLTILAANFRMRVF
jgi:cobalt/nickel transport system permease protein